jgi:hypothetical protein
MKPTAASDVKGFPDESLWIECRDVRSSRRPLRSSESVSRNRFYDDAPLSVPNAPSTTERSEGGVAGRMHSRQTAGVEALRNRRDLRLARSARGSGRTDWVRDVFVVVEIPA